MVRYHRDRNRNAPRMEKNVVIFKRKLAAAVHIRLLRGE
jgi:hypothetical protein